MQVVSERHYEHVNTQRTYNTIDPKEEQHKMEDVEENNKDTDEENETGKNDAIEEETVCGALYLLMVRNEKKSQHNNQIEVSSHFQMNKSIFFVNANTILSMSYIQPIAVQIRQDW